MRGGERWGASGPLLVRNGSPSAASARVNWEGSAPVESLRAAVGKNSRLRGGEGGRSLPPARGRAPRPPPSGSAAAYTAPGSKTAPES